MAGTGPAMTEVVSLIRSFPRRRESSLIALGPRLRLLIKSPRNVDLSHFMRVWLAHAPKTRGSLKLEVDIDPQSFF